MSESAKKRTTNRRTINNKCFIHKGNIQTCVDIEYLEIYYQQGWIKGMVPKTLEQKQNIRDIYTKSVYVNNGNKTILIKKRIYKIT